MAFIRLSVDDILHHFDLTKASPGNIRVSDGAGITIGMGEEAFDLEIDVEHPDLPEGRVEVHADFKYHDDGGITLLRINDVDLQDVAGEDD
ncbi:hypothetical protein HOU02_gp328 [Caulobacter phage CcrBL9]|uniref:Uncharacterized protein n=1 Tax=Caulobacter phage CcrBL9 TaxID=2283270 RepID=A0A385EF26_9CAUD|nr:hypothetical protein HOU02_gp328 [Caulobacter phage CcrBL9]AXQ69397.1 hypothetical protein CcrBL9_gp373 [Caulobacter phage CcrBL9]